MSKVSKIAQRLTRGSHPARARAAGGGRFSRGHTKTGGRQKGVPNVTTRVAKEAIIEALEQFGLDGEGKEGLRGAVKRALALDRTGAITLGFFRLILPLQHEINKQSVLNIRYETLEEIENDLAAHGLKVKDIYQIEYKPDEEGEEEK